MAISKVELGPISAGTHTLNIKALNNKFVKLDVFFIRNALPADSTLKAEDYYAKSYLISGEEIRYII